MLVEKKELATVRFGRSETQLTSTQSWVAFWSLFAFGVATCYTLFKAGPVLTIIGADFGMGMDSVGNINGVFAIAAMIFAFPGAWIVRNIGVKASIMATAVITLIGTVMVLMVNTAETFMFARFLEGAGFGLIAVIGPNVMIRLFPQEKLGLVMGIWSLWVPVGTILAFFSAPGISEAFGWQGLWWVSIAMEIITGIWLFVSFKVPRVAENTIVAGDTAQKKIAKKTFVVSAIVIAIAFVFWVYAYAGVINTFYPTYLQQVKGMSIFDSSMVTVLAAIVTIPAGIAFGIFSDRTNTRKWFVVLPFAILAIMCATFAFSDDADIMGPWIFSIILGLCAGGIPMGCRSIIPILAYDPVKTDYALAVMAFTTGVGLFFMTTFGTAVAAMGWHMSALMILTPLCVLGAVMTLLCKSDKKALIERGDLVDSKHPAPLADAVSEEA